MRTIAACALSIVLLAAVLLAAAAHAQQTRDLQMTCDSASRAAEYPPAPNTVLRARDGGEFVVLLCQVSVKETSDLYSEQETTLIDSDGANHSIAISNLKFPRTSATPTEQTFVFAVKKGQGLRELRVGPLTFNLAGK